MLQFSMPTSSSLDIFPEFRNRLTGEIVSMRTAADLLKLYEAHATRFNEVHLSTALQRFSQLRGRAFLDAEPLEAPDSAEAPVADEAAPGVSAEEQTLLDALCDDCTASMVAQTSVWQSRGLANVALSLAKLWVADEALFDAVAKRALQLEADAFTPECVATLAQGFARANAAGRYDALYDVLSASAQRRISDFGKRELSALALGFAIGRCSSPQQRYSPLSARPPQEDDDEDDERRTKAKSFQDAKLFDAIEKRSMQLVEDFGPEDLSMTANAFAVVLDGRARSGLFEAMARRAIVDGVLKMSDVNLAHLARAFAVQKPRIGNQQRLFRAIANAVPRLQRCGAQSLWSLAHAFSAADAASAPLFQHIHAASLTRISTDFSPKGVALLAHAFSQASFDVPDLYAACAKAALDDIDHFSTTHLAMLARSLATVGYLDEDLFRAITEACEMRVDEMDLQSRPASWIVLEWIVSGVESRAKKTDGGAASGTRGFRRSFSRCRETRGDPRGGGLPCRVQCQKNRAEECTRLRLCFLFKSLRKLKKNM
ncbi:hypothetical protein M885DRAFT_76586 [Pelagophyceae sp. CCMP2097]|nr:hypothetical protein M885DRAFT_76586 [Pelagophyceae sp. CCMP2097]